MKRSALAFSPPAPITGAPAAFGPPSAKYGRQRSHELTSVAPSPLVQGLVTLRACSRSQVAAFSHSTSVGSRIPRLRAYARASNHETPTTGSFSVPGAGRPFAHPAGPGCPVRSTSCGRQGAPSSPQSGPGA